jgi:hypothetical protein
MSYAFFACIYIPATLLVHLQRPHVYALYTALYRNAHVCAVTGHIKDTYSTLTVETDTTA